MPKETAFMMTLEPELSEVIQCQRAAREYDAFLRSKVDAGRVSMHAGVAHSNAEVEATFAARRAVVLVSF